jgi:hypothetical protein
MARIDIANIYGSKLKHVNISDVVGSSGKNEKNDVMLIQALFKIAGYGNDLIAMQLFGVKNNALPDVTGTLDSVTIQTIWSFQRQNASRLLSIDGKIHPASYQNRVIKNTRGSVMAITFLNLEAESQARQRFKNVDIPSVVKKFAPSIMFT